MWVRRDGAFPSIVSADLFLRAAQIIESRKHRSTDNEMLDQMRSLLAKKGRLSGRLIDEAKGMLGSRAYLDRFGGLRRAYEKIGYMPRRDLSFLDVGSNLKARRSECLNQILSKLRTNGATVATDPKTEILRVNGDFALRLVLARCHKTLCGRLRWHVRLNPISDCDLTIAARMNEDNTYILDYYLFPRREHVRNDLILAQENSVMLDVYRFENLDQVYRLCRQRRIGDPT